jgi:hypothetical protein
VRIEVPSEGHQWLTEGIARLLGAIRGVHAAKKRATIIKVAFARANEQPLKKVFRQKSVCSEVIWYTKWRHDAKIKSAFEACYQRALEWRDEETAAIEEHYRRERRQSVAKLAAEAPGALAEVMQDPGEKGGDRISAANALMGWADPEAASKVRPASPASIEQRVDVLAGMSDEEIEERIEALLQEAGAGEVAGGEETPATGEAEAADPGGDGSGEIDA